MRLSFLKHPLFKGTLILTLAGIITRLIGFFYKIYLAGQLGTTQLGIYQLIFPVYSLCFTIYGAGMQTAISQLIAARQGERAKHSHHPETSSILRCALAVSLTLALLLSAFVCIFSKAIARHFLLEEACAPSLCVLSILFPFCAVTACLNGYYYGMERTKVPALTQMVEQLARVLFVYLISTFLLTLGKKPSCELAVAGIVAGEMISNFFIMGCYHFQKKKTVDKTCDSCKKIFKRLMHLAIPLTATKMITGILHSAETILIPGMLKRYGLSADDALSIYGVLTGMALTFLTFPSTLTGSFAVLLLPAISQEQARQNYKKISHMIAVTLKYSLLIGLLFITLFFLYGPLMGTVFFHNTLCGRFLVILSFLSPFLYLSTTLGSIINGLGKTNYTFFCTISGLGLRILFVIFAIPRYGIHGYLVGLLFSQVFITLFEMFLLKKLVAYKLDAVQVLLLPILCMFLSGSLSYLVFHRFTAALPDLFRLISGASVATLCFILLLLFSGCIQRKDFPS